MPFFAGFSTFFRIPEAAEGPESGHYRSPDRVFPRFSALKYKKIAQSADYINAILLPVGFMCGFAAEAALPKIGVDQKMFKQIA